MVHFFVGATLVCEEEGMLAVLTGFLHIRGDGESYDLSPSLHVR